jgi:linoleoyl-CoA desaturase
MSTATLDPPRPAGPVLHPVPSTPAAGADLPAERVEELGRRLDALREAVVADLGADDAAYIRNVIKAQRALEVAGRALLMAGALPPAWVAGTAALALSKVLENMELGHNIMHGQWDWMRDPRIHSSTWDWDNASPAEAWKHSHNYLHHTFTNVVGKDRDVGYGVLRMSEEQAWRPAHLLNPAVNVLLSLTFQWGVALHDVELDRLRTGEQSRAEAWRVLKGVGRKVRKQVLKDYVAFPLLGGPSFGPVLLGNLTANLVRNVWSHAVIFCGHFPDGAVQFEERQLEGETRGQWYVRQMMGATNLDGGPLFHLLTGNLSFQIEHHCFPDVPSNRLAELAPQVRALCEEYGIDYTSGPLSKQYLQVLRTINRLALP